MKKPSSISTIMTAVTLLGITGMLIAAPMKARMDDRVESVVKKSYVFKNYLKDDDITVMTSKDSVVTLTGTVSEWTHKSLAEETVAQISGVKSVNNKLTVKGDQPTENSDGWIAMKIKSTLLFHRNLSGMTTKVEVKDSVVTLRGEAANAAQKDLTTEYALDVDGVKSVKNEMTLEKTGKPITEKVGDQIDDASIFAQVKLALLFHRSTNVIGTKVAVKNGTVTLTGEAKTSAEKDLVGKLVGNIKGANVIKNEMTVK